MGKRKSTAFSWRIAPFREEVRTTFDQVMTTLDRLVANDEKREEENLALNEPFKRHDHHDAGYTN